MFLEELKNELDGLLELFDENDESGEYTFLNSVGYGEIRLSYSSGSNLMFVEAEYDDEYQQKTFTCDHKGLTKCVSFVNKMMDLITY
jgi:hypothetical protein